MNGVEDDRAAQRKWEVGMGRDRKKELLKPGTKQRSPQCRNVKGQEGRGGRVGENCRGCGDDCTIQQRSACACGCACVPVCVSGPIQDYGTLPS